MINLQMTAFFFSSTIVSIIATLLSVFISAIAYMIWKFYDRRSSRDILLFQSKKSASFLLKHNGGEEDPCSLQEIEEIPMEEYFPSEKWKELANISRKK